MRFSDKILFYQNGEDYIVFRVKNGILDLTHLVFVPNLIYDIYNQFFPSEFTDEKVVEFVTNIYDIDSSTFLSDWNSYKKTLIKENILEA